MPSDDIFDQAWDLAKQDVGESDFEKGLIEDFRNARRQAQLREAYRDEVANTLMGQINPRDKFRLPEPVIEEPVIEEPAIEEPAIEEPKVEPETKPDTLADIPEEKVEESVVEPETKPDTLAEIPKPKKTPKKTKAGDGMKTPEAEEDEPKIEYADDRGDDRFNQGYEPDGHGDKANHHFMPQPDDAEKVEELGSPIVDAKTQGMGDGRNGVSTPNMTVPQDDEKEYAENKINALTLIDMMNGDNPEDVGRSFATLCKLAAGGSDAHIDQLNQFNRTSEVKLLADKMNTTPKEINQMRKKSVIEGKENQLLELQAKQDRATLEENPDMDYTDTAAFKLPESVNKLNRGKAQTSMTDNPEQALEAWGEGKPIPVLDVRGNPVKLNGKTGWTVGRGKNKDGKAITVAFHPDRPEGVPLNSLKRPNKALGQTTSRSISSTASPYTTVDQVKRQSEGTRNRAVPLPLYFPMPGSKAINQKTGKVIKSETWTPVANPFANPFHNPEAFRVNNTPPPVSTEQAVEAGAWADTTDGPVFVSNPAHDILAKSGFDTREGDDLSMLPSMMPKEDTSFSNTSLLPRGWDSE